MFSSKGAQIISIVLFGLVWNSVPLNILTVFLTADLQVCGFSKN